MIIFELNFLQLLIPVFSVRDFQSFFEGNRYFTFL
jgi:hypothetical protein